MTKEIKMTKAEALRNIRKLEDYVKKLDEEKVGYKEDQLFLLSKEEYAKYADVIPECQTTWWLRSPSSDDMIVTTIVCVTHPVSFGNFVSYTTAGIRPALKINTYDYKVGEIIVYKKSPFTVIDKDLCVATVPIDFDVFDEENNDYKTSKVRKFLFDFANK